MKPAATVRVIQNGRQYSLSANGAADVLTVLRHSRFTIAAPCGGMGTCGKCLVRVTEGDSGEPSTMEHRLLSAAQLAAGIRFACRLFPTDGLTLEIPDWQSGTRNKAELFDDMLENDPIVVKRSARLAAPSIADQTPDLERMLTGAGCKAHRLSADSLRTLAADLRRSDYLITALVSVESDDGDELLALESGDTSASFWGVAIDIGTTTVAAYLVDLLSARAVDVCSELNRQAEFGADVVTRISYSQAHGVAPLQKTVVAQVDGMISILAQRNNLSETDIYLISAAGNTTMQHFFTGLDPAAIGVSPYIPVATRALSFQVPEIGISINPRGMVTALPGVSAYVGADLVAAIVASRMHERSDISLLIDIGTNGEIVLGNADWLVACSTAAGPAFEGARIRFGAGGVDGAINSFVLSDDQARLNGAEFSAVTCTTINSAPATGICGSAMLDILATLLQTGVVDGSGRLLPHAELPVSVPAALRCRCRDFESAPAFLVIDGGQSRNGEPIYLTERDVRELQLAKAAIAAGIEVLLDTAGIKIDDVSTAYLAGGFGSYMNAESALRVGLLPLQTRGRIEVLGNAAGIGAVMALTSRNVSRQFSTTARTVRYIELSTSAAFQNAYIEHMSFDRMYFD